MNAKSLKRSLFAIALAGMSFLAEARTKVVFFFDIANIFSSEGIRGHFAMIGYLGQKLVEWRRVDVLDALGPHLVGTQTLYHSLHPNITESTDIEDYAKAREIAFEE